MNESPNESAKMILEYGEWKATTERLLLEQVYIADALEDLKESYVLCGDKPTEGDFDRIIPTVLKTLDAYNCYEIHNMLPINRRL
tara:strand:- start:130 stop:384 length:255 start_codon:yes stop_codon:yes gene_type:complete